MSVCIYIYIYIHIHISICTYHTRVRTRPTLGEGRFSEDFSRLPKAEHNVSFLDP